jgi:hypothetical protein
MIYLTKLTGATTPIMLHFCELCVEEIRAGNTNNGHLTNRGYTNIAANFEEQTGLHHSKRQFKNRWDALRRMYTFWLWLNKQSGLGRSGGTVVADDAWWKKHTKVMDAHLLPNDILILLMILEFLGTNLFSRFVTGSYGLRSTNKMSSIESLAMFLWVIGAPQSIRQAENRFERSTETVSRKFE